MTEPCRGCGQPTIPNNRARGLCGTCRIRARRHAPRLVDDGRRELWVAESYGPGWYVRQGGAWWQVAAFAHGWARRVRAELPEDGVPVSNHNAAVWMRWLGVPEGVIAND